MLIVIDCLRVPTAAEARGKTVEGVERGGEKLHLDLLRWRIREVGRQDDPCPMRRVGMLDGLAVADAILVPPPVSRAAAFAAGLNAAHQDALKLGRAIHRLPTINGQRTRAHAKTHFMQRATKVPTNTVPPTPAVKPKPSRYAYWNAAQPFGQALTITVADAGNSMGALR